MSGLTIYEFDSLAVAPPAAPSIHAVPRYVFDWLEDQCLRFSELRQTPWIRLRQRNGCRVIQVTNFVGVIRAPKGYQIEVLPKVGKSVAGGPVEARRLLIEMLCCLQAFRHIRTESAFVAAASMPLLEVFIYEFLHCVETIAKRGLRSSYALQQGNVVALRGKLLIASHLRENLLRADRFFTEHDVFSTNRPENRIIRAALKCVLHLSSSQQSQKLARELDFVFADVPPSGEPNLDLRRVQLDRSMGNYRDALAWAQLILNEESPLTGAGKYHAPSLLFPMEAVFEAFVAKHLIRQLRPPVKLKTQPRHHYLVRHEQQSWFQLRPDLLIQEGGRNLLVLDTKWKLLDVLKSNSEEKYGLSQADFYQLQAYGQSYLDGSGDVVLIYPKTSAFEQPLPVFAFPKFRELRLWVLPFCLNSRRLLLPEGATHIGAVIN